MSSEASRTSHLQTPQQQQLACRQRSNKDSARSPLSATVTLIRTGDSSYQVTPYRNFSSQLKPESPLGDRRAAPFTANRGEGNPTAPARYSRQVSPWQCVKPEAAHRAGPPPPPPPPAELGLRRPARQPPPPAAGRLTLLMGDHEDDGDGGPVAERLRLLHQRLPHRLEGVEDDEGAAAHEDPEDATVHLGEAGEEDVRGEGWGTAAAAPHLHRPPPQQRRRQQGEGEVAHQRPGRRARRQPRRRPRPPQQPVAAEPAQGRQQQLGGGGGPQQPRPRSHARRHPLRRRRAPPRARRPPPASPPRPRPPHPARSGLRWRGRAGGRRGGEAGPAGALTASPPGLWAGSGPPRGRAPPPRPLAKSDVRWMGRRSGPELTGDCDRPRAGRGYSSQKIQTRSCGVEGGVWGGELC